MRHRDDVRQERSCNKRTQDDVHMVAIVSDDQQQCGGEGCGKDHHAMVVLHVALHV